MSFDMLKGRITILEVGIQHEQSHREIEAIIGKDLLANPKAVVI